MGVRSVSQAGRWLLMLDLLGERPEGLTPLELAAQLNCTPRTIYRDLEALQSELRSPLVSAREQGEEGGRWRLLEGTRFRVPIAFRPSEILAFLAARELLQPFAGTPFGEALNQFYLKVRARMPGAISDQVERLAEAFVAGAGPRHNYAAHAKTIETIQRAIQDRTTVEMQYRSRSSGERTRRVDPYRLWFPGDALYVVGHCHVHREPRTFSIQRVVSAHTTRDRFAIPKTFRWDDFTRDSFRIFRGTKARVVVDFSPAVAPLIRERPWHASQKLTELADGAVRIALDVAGLFEVAHWIAGYGADARVVEPPELVAYFREQARAMAAAYSERGSGKFSVARAARVGRKRRATQ